MRGVGRLRVSNDSEIGMFWSGVRWPTWWPAVSWVRHSGVDSGPVMVSNDPQPITSCYLHGQLKKHNVKLCAQLGKDEVGRQGKKSKSKLTRQNSQVTQWQGLSAAWHWSCAIALRISRGRGGGLHLCLYHTDEVHKAGQVEHQLHEKRT